MILYEKSHCHKKFILWEHVLILYHWVPLMLLGSYSLGIGESTGEQRAGVYGWGQGTPL